MTIRLPTAHDKDFFDIDDFENRIISAYNDGSASDVLAADSAHARSLSQQVQVVTAISLTLLMKYLSSLLMHVLVAWIVLQCALIQQFSEKL